MKNTYLKVFLILCVLIFGTIATSNAQYFSSGKRILISSPTQDDLEEIQEAGLDLHCGAKFEQGNLRLDLSTTEVEIVNQLGINYQILQEDLTTFLPQELKTLESRQ